MHVNISSIDPATFQIDPRVLPGFGDVVLVTPTKTKHRWTEEEIPLRSVLLDPSGLILSSGFPKFLNFGEDPLHDERTLSALSRGRVIFPEKLDGSLIIRSVIGGKVVLRTRGSHEVNADIREDVERLVYDRYRGLLNVLQPGSTGSYLFEYTGPDNQIVLRYDEPRLTALGYIDHPADADGVPALHIGQDVVHRMGMMFGTPSMPFHDLPRDIDGLSRTVKAWNGLEGVVAWMHLPDGTAHLAKFKAMEYLKAHAVRSILSGYALRQFCYVRGIFDASALADTFFGLGLDWETVTFLRPEFDAFVAQRAEIDAKINRFVQAVNAAGIPGLPSRKDKVQALQQMTGYGDFAGLFQVGIYHSIGEGHRIQAIKDGMLLGISPANAIKLKQTPSDVIFDLSRYDRYSNE